MESFNTTKNFFKKYLILELYEKLYRLQKYIDTCEKFDRKNNTVKITELFYDAIAITGNEVNELCSLVDSDFSEDDEFAFIVKISQHSKAIAKIHEELKNLHSSWILPEIKTFTNDILNNKSSQIKDVNIILSDSYSFLERNLGKKFKRNFYEVYSNQYLSNSIRDNHSFILPKIEFSNPLNWTIIVHEAGHLQHEIIESIKSDPDIMPDSIQSLNEHIIKNWAEEIFCDIYATSILGPAYFLSFVSFALLSTIDYGVSTFSDDHPSVIVRASLILSYLKNNSLTFESDWGINDYTTIFYNSLIHQSEIFNDEKRIDIPGLTKFNRNLRQRLKALQLNNFQIQEEDSIRINLLVDKLQKGIPIGSVYALNRSSSYLVSDEITIDQLEPLKTKVTERSCKTWEILNAGWIYKIENNFKRGCEIFFDNQESSTIKEKISTYGDVINSLDERLLSSINTSQIIKIIESH